MQHRTDKRTPGGHSADLITGASGLKTGQPLMGVVHEIDCEIYNTRIERIIGKHGAAAQACTCPAYDNLRSEERQMTEQKNPMAEEDASTKRGAMEGAEHPPRVLTDHICNPVNDKVLIQVFDPPGPGGAHHEYGVSAGPYIATLCFQNGPIDENGVNGLTQEALLAIVIDRLRCFQAGPFSCRENALALTKCEEALMWLQSRTRERMKRGVEGKTLK